MSFTTTSRPGSIYINTDIEMDFKDELELDPVTPVNNQHITSEQKKPKIQRILQPTSWFHFDSYHPKQAVISGFKAEQSPWILFGVRVTFSIYFLIVLIYDINEFGWDLVRYMRWYSHINFVFGFIYFSIGAYKSGKYNFTNLNKPTDVFPWKKVNRNSEIAFWIAFEILTTNAFLINTVIWWLLVYDGTNFDGLSGVTEHIMFPLIMASELFMTQLPFVPTHLIFAEIYGGFYLLFLWIIYAITGRWMYWFLDWKTNHFAIFIHLLVPVGIIVFFFVGIMLTWVRDWAIGKHHVQEDAETFHKLQTWDAFNVPALTALDEEEM